MGNLPWPGVLQTKGEMEKKLCLLPLGIAITHHLTAVVSLIYYSELSAVVLHVKEHLYTIIAVQRQGVTHSDVT